VGAPGFEPGTSPTRTVRATRLRHAPNDLSVIQSGWPGGAAWRPPERTLEVQPPAGGCRVSTVLVVPATVVAVWLRTVPTTPLACAITCPAGGSTLPTWLAIWPSVEVGLGTLGTGGTGTAPPRCPAEVSGSPLLGANGRPAAAVGPWFRARPAVGSWLVRVLETGSLGGARRPWTVRTPSGWARAAALIVRTWACRGAGTAEAGVVLARRICGAGAVGCRLGAVLGNPPPTANSAAAAAIARPNETAGPVLSPIDDAVRAWRSDAGSHPNGMSAATRRATEGACSAALSRPARTSPQRRPLSSSAYSSVSRRLARNNVLSTTGREMPMRSAISA